MFCTLRKYFLERSVDIILKASIPKLREKLLEALQAVLPIVAIVLVLCFSIAPVSPSILLCFLLGAAMIIVGIMFFTLGAEMSMSPMGERVGAMLTKSRSVPLIIGVGFLLGFLITISEPDLQVLANQVPNIPNAALIGTVALGVGIFLIIAMLRILFGISLNILLIGFYIVVFLMAMFVPKNFWAVAFDSGGVTTGPMTVPFIMALGVGVSAIRSDRHAGNDSFGLVALCSIGPILAVLVLGLLYPSEAAYTPVEIPEMENSQEMIMLFVHGLPHYAKEVAIALAPIVAFFFLFNAFYIKMPKKPLISISVGLLFTYLGLLLFLTGVNVGFMPVGNYIGKMIGSKEFNWILLPIAMLIGYFIVKAEPAVHVLNKQVEDLTAGSIPARAMELSLSIGVASSLGLAMIRVLTGISVMYFLIPGYVLALGLSFFAPKIFTSIAFDSGGVASGPMTATFLLPFAMGACEAIGGPERIVSDAFGVVAMVAMTPLITIQLLGVEYKFRTRKEREARARVQAKLEAYADDDIIEL